jgi:hypothetical protein
MRRPWPTMGCSVTGKKEIYGDVVLKVIAK